jgi:hypothetical protein
MIPPPYVQKEDMLQRLSATSGTSQDVIARARRARCDLGW